MKITIELDTLDADWAPSWESVQNLLRTCVSNREPHKHHMAIVTCERETLGHYREAGVYRIGVRNGEQGYAGTVTVEGVRERNPLDKKESV